MQCLAAVQCPRDPALCIPWAVLRAGSAPHAHALAAARATVGARHVLLALADARVLNRAQGGDLQEGGAAGVSVLAPKARSGGLSLAVGCHDVIPRDMQGKGYGSSSRVS